jgi:hypothetical protein
MEKKPGLEKKGERPLTLARFGTKKGLIDLTSMRPSKYLYQMEKRVQLP